MIKYFDIFAGIGGFRSGLEKAGGFECIGYCEIDKYARLACVQYLLQTLRSKEESVLILITSTTLSPFISVSRLIRMEEKDAK